MRLHVKAEPIKTEPCAALTFSQIALASRRSGRTGCQPMHIDIYSDTICPWCFIGKRRLERALAARPELKVTIRWRAFQLNPWMPATGMPRGEYLKAKFGSTDAGRIYETIRRVGASEGIEFRFDLIPRTPNTLRSHRMIAHASDAGLQDEMVEALFNGYFIEGRDIGDPATLVELAEDAGLDPEEARRCLEGDAGVEAAAREDAAARGMGIQGVPCFIVDGAYAISGAQEPEYFYPLFDLVASTAPALDNTSA